MSGEAITLLHTNIFAEIIQEPPPFYYDQEHESSLLRFLKRLKRSFAPNYLEKGRVLSQSGLD